MKTVSILLLSAILVFSASCKKKTANYKCTCQSKMGGVYTEDSQSFNDVTFEDAEQKCGVADNFYYSPSEYKQCSVAKE
ncbi:MAG: hypothetical protein J0M08_06655 [Bacteroidetes bacterium]|nr:hypothetical protein [Bacteroidota bacterium]